ncbi:hypothetical protein HG535_0D01290 [Zygotorulaspora mrakii]|uniref:C2H2-type domain-containing protein n=1 Tax=Zygotorulaspora mrakii TaxID=42260 RepID=A0A7H9B1B4_ZYGMR|nr:uncharacterized protein HG535_0D01290 [Zygotorulaspora mrakii]QLG72421.1 hypothetical protein HG535_0D01290 [Zygotorulaspora mrakii]
MSNFGRRTWDREEYAKLASEGQLTHEQSLKSSLTPAQFQQLKRKYTNFHGLMQDAIKNLNTKVLTTGLSSYKKGKQFGFYCELCNLTFKDTMQYIDHLNHKTHQLKFESIFDEPLINDTRDNDMIEKEEFEGIYHSIIDQFISLHGTKKPRKSKKASIRQALLQKEEHPTELELAMGFKAFGNANR